jgi:hypothetical protein
MIHGSCTHLHDFSSDLPGIPQCGIESRFHFLYENISIRVFRYLLLHSRSCLTVKRLARRFVVGKREVLTAPLLSVARPVIQDMERVGVPSGGYGFVGEEFGGSCASGANNHQTDETRTSLLIHGGEGRWQQSPNVGTHEAEQQRRQGDVYTGFFQSTKEGDQVRDALGKDRGRQWTEDRNTWSQALGEDGKKTPVWGSVMPFSEISPVDTDTLAEHLHGMSALHKDSGVLATPLPTGFIPPPSNASLPFPWNIPAPNINWGIGGSVFRTGQTPSFPTGRSPPTMALASAAEINQDGSVHHTHARTHTHILHSHSHHLKSFLFDLCEFSCGFRRRAGPVDDDAAPPCTPVRSASF